MEVADRTKLNSDALHGFYPITRETKMNSNQENRIPLSTDGACNDNLRAYYQKLPREKRYLVTVELRDASKAPANSPASRSVKVSSMNAVYGAVTDLAGEYHLEEVAERETKKTEVVPTEITDGSLDDQTCAIYEIEAHNQPSKRGIAYKNLQTGEFFEAWIESEDAGAVPLVLEKDNKGYKATLVCTLPMAHFKAYEWRIELIHSEPETLPQPSDYEGIPMDILIFIALAEIDLGRVGKGTAENFTYPVPSFYKESARVNFRGNRECE